MLNKGPIGEDSLLEIIIERHPYRNLIGLYPATRGSINNRFNKALGLAFQKGLVYKNENGQIQLTEEGKAFLEKILDTRRRILQDGFWDRDVLPEKISFGNEARRGL